MNLFLTLAFLFCIGSVLGWGLAVSYTHLDVYKRQAEKRRRYCRKTAFRFPLCRVCPPATAYRHMPASL